MTIQSTRLFNFAEVAFAAYGNLQVGSVALQLNELAATGMSPRQATEFAKRFPDVVFPTYRDSASDLDVTVFRGADGHLILAIRGTLPGHDLNVTDAQVALNGAGYDQIVALYNWWQRVSNPSGSSVSQFVLAEYADGGPALPPPGAVKLFPSTAFSSIYLAAAASATATGELTAALAADLDHKIDVTGHSLGAHLTLAFNALFASSVGQAVGFDTPGFANTAINQQFFAALSGALPTNANSGNFVSVIADETSVGEKPFNAIAGVWSRPGVAVDIGIENQWQSDETAPESVLNHSMRMLTDSLATYNLLCTLDPNLTAAAYKLLLSAVANGTAARAMSASSTHWRLCSTSTRPS